MNSMLNTEHDEHAGRLKEIMNAIPMTERDHQAILRKRVAARRLIEDATEAAKQRRDDSL